MLLFELSNSCPYSTQHTRCPLSLQREPVTLPIAVIEDTLAFLEEQGWSGWVGFQNYNEPLVDPRLYYLIRYVKHPVRLWTNGYGLSQVLVDELTQAGVKDFEISAYSTKEWERLSGLRFSVPARVNLRGLDKRLDMYGFPPNQGGPCPRSAPLHDIIIRRTGKVGLCCFDWRGDHDMGSLRESWGQLEALSEELKRGRPLELCRRCDMSKL